MLRAGLAQGALAAAGCTGAGLPPAARRPQTSLPAPLSAPPRPPRPPAAWKGWSGGRSSQTSRRSRPLMWTAARRACPWACTASSGRTLRRGRAACRCSRPPRARAVSWGAGDHAASRAGGLQFLHALDLTVAARAAARAACQQPQSTCMRCCPRHQRRKPASALRSGAPHLCSALPRNALRAAAGPGVAGSNAVHARQGELGRERGPGTGRVQGGWPSRLSQLFPSTVASQGAGAPQPLWRPARQGLPRQAAGQESPGHPIPAQPPPAWLPTAPAGVSVHGVHLPAQPPGALRVEPAAHRV